MLILTEEVKSKHYFGHAACEQRIIDSFNSSNKTTSKLKGNELDVKKFIVELLSCCIRKLTICI